MVSDTQKEATSSSVTMEKESSSNSECIKDKDDYDVTSLSGVVCAESSDSEIVTVKCEECGKDIPLDEWIEHTDYHVAATLQDAINKSPIVVPSIPRPLSSSQKSQKTTPSRTSKKTSSVKAKLSRKPQTSTLDRFLNKSST